MTKRILPVVLAVLVLASGATALYALSELQSLRSEISSLRETMVTPEAQPSDTLWSAGRTDSETGDYTEWVGLYPSSTLYDSDGAPSLRFRDLARDDPDKPRDFEIGFYRYGPTWYTQNSIIEFWIGNGGGGTFSIVGNHDGGGQLHVRNPFDNDGISLDFRNADRPTISTETGIALHFSAQQGLISDNKHTFEQGISIDGRSDYTGQMSGSTWADGRITVPSSAVESGSIILITPVSLPPSQWWISNIIPGQSFTISSATAGETMDFNWLIISTD